MCFHNSTQSAYAPEGRVEEEQAQQRFTINTSPNTFRPKVFFLKFALFKLWLRTLFLVKSELVQKDEEEGSLLAALKAFL